MLLRPTQTHMVLCPVSDISAYVCFLGIIFFDVEFQTALLFFSSTYYFPITFHPSRCSVEFCPLPKVNLLESSVLLMIQSEH